MNHSIFRRRLWSENSPAVVFAFIVASYGSQIVLYDIHDGKLAATRTLLSLVVDRFVYRVHAHSFLVDVLRGRQDRSFSSLLSSICIERRLLTVLRVCAWNSEKASDSCFRDSGVVCIHERERSTISIQPVPTQNNTREGNVHHCSNQPLFTRSSRNS